MKLRLLLHVLILEKRRFCGQLFAPEVKAVLPMLAPDAICLDVGAHCGSWAIPLSRRIPAGQVIAVEASSYYAELLKVYCAWLRRKNIVIVNAAAGDGERIVDLVERGPDRKRLTGLTHIRGSAEATVGASEIEMKSLSNIVPRSLWTRTRFIKCDVEGAERMVFEGAIEIIKVARPVVYTEINARNCRRYGYSQSVLDKIFADHDYKRFALSGNNSRIKAMATITEDTNDVLYIPNEQRSQYADVTD